MIRRTLVWAAGISLLFGCGSGSNGNARLSGTQDVAAVVAFPAHDRLTITGTVIDREKQTADCAPRAFALVYDNRPHAPVAGGCIRAHVPPGDAAEFSMTFALPPSNTAQLQFAHPDGSVERQDVNVPPQ
jgi:hypothetical protein